MKIKKELLYPLKRKKVRGNLDMLLPEYSDLSFKVLFNCLCPKCKTYQAERIGVKRYGIGYVGYIGCDCKCGYKRKANLKEIICFSSLIKKYKEK